MRRNLTITHRTESLKQPLELFINNIDSLSQYIADFLGCVCNWTSHKGDFVD